MIYNELKKVFKYTFPKKPEAFLLGIVGQMVPKKDRTFFMHASSFPLPRQPLPSLAETTARYLRSLEPLVSPEELEQTQQLLAEFGVPGGEGERLQARLQRRADRMENWITDWWVQSAYLESRLPLAVHSSPAVVLPKQDFNDWKGQLSCCWTLTFINPKQQGQWSGMMGIVVRKHPKGEEVPCLCFKMEALVSPFCLSHPLSLCLFFPHVCLLLLATPFSQFIVGEDGSCGVLYEQAVAEGPPIATIIDHVLDYCKDPVPVRAPLIPLQLPKKLYFCFTPEIKRDIEHAKQNLDILITDLDISCFTYCGFGKELLKRLRLSPDSVLQVALQLAYYRAHGELCATAESASLRRFHRGRTETIRSTTSAALAFVRAMADDDCQALAGQGIDRHLLGMKLEAIADGFRVPELFMDTSYAVASHWKLSTGQVAARTDCVMCYGPLVPDGYAVCYNPLPTHVNFAVTAFNCCQETNAEHLAGSIQKALDDVGALLGNWGVGSDQRQP
uniref:Choline/carnitine acyltransferase domain-containing protein n=1 Tax=Podarcis muralis TaxID=64176 RepID=A0A670I5Z1_PODMU